MAYIPTRRVHLPVGRDVPFFKRSASCFTISFSMPIYPSILSASAIFLPIVPIFKQIVAHVDHKHLLLVDDEGGFHASARQKQLRDIAADLVICTPINVRKALVRAVDALSNDNRLLTLLWFACGFGNVFGPNRAITPFNGFFKPVRAAALWAWLLI